MLMAEVDDADAARSRIAEQGVRLVHEGLRDDAVDLHLHPRDVGGTLLALDAMTPPGAWCWGGAAWEGTTPDTTGGLREVVVAVDEPATVARRWAALIGLPYEGGDLLTLDGGAQTVRFVAEPDRAQAGVVAATIDVPGGDGPHRGRRRRAARAAARVSFDRDDQLARLAAGGFDVVVVGGGITGAGVALDAAARGLRTAVLERDDWASGTSSKSSKMVHGGLRYLQQKEYRLVYENLAERQRLLTNAPHLVTPLPFLIPLFGKGGIVDKTVAKAYATSLRLYDLTGGLRIGKRYSRLTVDQVVGHLPTLRRELVAAGLPLLGRRRRRRPPDPRDRAHRGPGPRGRRRQPLPGHRAEQGRLRPGGRRPAGGRQPGRRRRGRQRRRRLVRRGAGARRGQRPAVDPAGQGHPPHRPAGQAARRHRHRPAGAQGAALGLRGAVGGPHLPGHDRHRLHRPAGRPAGHAGGRRVRPGRRERAGHLAAHPGRRRRELGRPATAGAGRVLGADRGPVPPARGAGQPERPGHHHRRQAHDLPQDGAGHRRRGAARAGSGAERLPDEAARPARGAGSGCCPFGRHQRPPARPVRRGGRRGARPRRRRPLARGAAGGRPAVPAGRGRVRRARRDGPHPDRRAEPAHSRAAARPGRHCGGGGGRRAAARAGAGLGRRSGCRRRWRPSASWSGGSGTRGAQGPPQDPAADPDWVAAPAVEGSAP